MNTQPVFPRYLWFLFGIFLASGFFLPGYYEIPYPKSLGPEFKAGVKREHINTISQNQPDVVLLGDSVLLVGVDNEELSNELDLKTYSIGIPGSGSAVWYLILKNVILESAYLPKYVVILFRDTKLTIPALHTTGRYFNVVDDFAERREPLVAQLAFINQLSPVEKLAEQYIPIYSARWEIRDGLDARIRYTAPFIFMNCPLECTDKALDSMFGKEDMNISVLNQAVENLYESEFMDFKGQVEKSFLPAMIQLARDNNITLVFVRTKSLTFPEYASETPALRGYIKSLNSYLSELDHVYFVDLAHDERIKNSYFEDLMHLNPEGKAVFTQTLADELKYLLK